MLKVEVKQSKRALFLLITLNAINIKHVTFLMPALWLRSEHREQEDEDI